jgi:hypothetical protein
MFTEDFQALSEGECRQGKRIFPEDFWLPVRGYGQGKTGFYREISGASRRRIQTKEEACLLKI